MAHAAAESSMSSSETGGLPGSERPPRAENRLQAILQDYERRLILLALEADGGNQSRAAGRLGILPSTLSMKLRRFGIVAARDVPRHPFPGSIRPAEDETAASDRGR